MNSRLVLHWSVWALLVCAWVSPPWVHADKLALKDGTEIDGSIRKIEKGTVTVQVGEEIRTFDIMSVRTMEFEMPRLETGTSSLPLEHFLAGMEAQEMLDHVRKVEAAAAGVRTLIDQTRKEWADRKSVEPGRTKQWEAAKERFRAPVSRYQEALNDLYFHVLGKVDEYNRLMKDANAVYVGVKGWFNVGSALIPKDMEKLPLKKYVPSNWRDTIYYEGYTAGYNDAYEKYSTTFHLPYEAPLSPGTE
jgi:hypothetical protein